jgi:acetyl esterase/lipase
MDPHTTSPPARSAFADRQASARLPLEPAMATAFEDFPDLTVTGETLPGIRQLMAAFEGGPVPAELEVTDHVIGDGVLVTVTRRGATAAAPQPCVLSIHGGGYVLGEHTMDDERNRAWVTGLGCVTAAVRYRLAPEHPYPAALDDCWAALGWVHEHADELSIDPARTGIAGLSAGGGLAAALALRARERGGRPIAFQLLDSPMLDDRQATPSSRADWLVIWNRTSNQFGWRSYLGGLYGTDHIPDEAAPARATDLGGLPPALVQVGGADGFRDEDIDYATRLSQAGVPTELHVYPGAPHGFTVFAEAPTTLQAIADASRWLERQFAT